MQESKLEVIVGGLLHDIGKPAYRGDKTKNHSVSGYEFLKDDVGIKDKEILEQVKYHHKNMIEKSSIDDNSPAYITYIADNIASGADRRKVDENQGFDMDMQLESVFNILNGNNQHYKYKPQTMEEKNGINYPIETEISFSKEIYKKICDDVADCLKGIDEKNSEYINSLLEVMEADCTFIPSSTNKNEIADISLYDHCKITAAIGSCIIDYLEEQGITNYRDELYKKSKQFYSKKAFLMYSFDISGIQDFIYTISAKGSLKLLRSRSFYLEMLCEHLIDTILKRLEYSRANLIYSGGGHGYILLANTSKNKSALGDINDEINHWCIDNFKTALYVADGYAECSADDLMNSNGTYEDIFRAVSKVLSDRKSNRYTAKQILEMNNNHHQDGERECRICKRSDTDIENDVCGMCQKLMDMSDDILEKQFFVVLNNDSGLPLPFGQSLIATSEDGLKAKWMSDEAYERSYGKNKMYTGRNLSTKLWVGDYHTDKEFKRIAQKSTGVERIGIIRGDVDNLGKAFVSGFSKEQVSLSRTAVFSRKLSIFFKKHINKLLKDKGINGLIVYSGGDDIFLVCAWSDAIEAAMMLNEALHKFTQDTLTISMGIGIYNPSYPIASMAYESGDLESVSKSSGRNKVTLFSANNSENEKYTFDWNELENKVIGEKKKCIEEYFIGQTEHGKNLLYNLLNYLRNTSEKINIARYAYLLARIEPDRDADEHIKEKYKAFSRQMYNWAINKEDRLQLIMAIYLYVYETREKSEE